MVVKATRYEIQIGDYFLDAFLMPDGKTVKLSGRGLTNIVGKENRSLVRFFKVKSLNDLPNADSSVRSIKNDTGGSFIPVALEDAIEYWFEAGGEIGRELVKTLAKESSKF